MAGDCADRRKDRRRQAVNAMFLDVRERFQYGIVVVLSVKLTVIAR
jgi:hypothetical protein